MTRDLAISLASRAGVILREQSLTRDDLMRVSELFLTGTGTEIMPVVRIDGRPVADGKPGPVTTAMYQHFREELRLFLAKKG